MWNSKYAFSLLLVFFIVITAFSSCKAITAYDTHLYHSSLVSWLNFSKIVPGIANLHSRLGQVSFYLILAAGIDIGIFDKYSPSILHFIFYFTGILYFIENIRRSDDRKDQSVSVILLFWLILCDNASPNLYYDVPAMLFTAVIFYEILANGKHKEPGTSDEVLFIFASMSFCIKQLGAINVAAVFLYGLFRLASGRKLTPLSFVRFVFIPSVFGASYLARNVIQSGFLLFPIPSLSFALPWTNRSVAVDNYTSVRGWARLPGKGYRESLQNGFLFWFPTWLKVNAKGNFIYFFLFVSASVLHYTVIRSRSRLVKGLQFAMMLLTAWLNIAFWFYSAPDFRFSSVFFFLYFALAVYFSGSISSRFFVLAFSSLYIAKVLLNMPLESFLICGLLLGICYYCCRADLLKRRFLLIAFIFLFGTVNQYGDNFKLHKLLPAKSRAFPCHKVTLENGQEPPLEVYVPDSGDQTGDAPLPCTPYPKNELKLIKPGDISSGFYYEAEVSKLQTDF